MDRAAIFAEVTQRNALRKAHGLPLLDIPAEYAHQVALANEREYDAVCDGHADERNAIRQQVLAEYRAERGPDFGDCMGGRWAVGAMTHKRFIAHMAERYGVFAPDWSSKHQIIYGAGRKAPVVD